MSRRLSGYRGGLLRAGSLLSVMGMTVCLLISVLCMTGCGMEDVKEFADTFRADDSMLGNMSDPSGDADYRTEVDRYGRYYDRKSKEAEQYYDEKTGEAVTAIQYRAYSFTDAFKKYGLYVAIPCLCIGFLIRRVVKNSASIRKLGLVLEVAIPVIYVVLAYIISALADAV